MSENVVIKKDRTVTVPASEAKIGVQYDHNVNVITFDCPRYPDDDRNVDMSTMQIYINYMLPDKTLGSYLAENVKVDTNNPDTIHFDWKITRNVTQVKGALQALVCIKKVDAEGNELYHWNTDLIQSFRVGEGMECLETISSDYADVISQLLVNMNTVTGEFEALSADVTARTSEETLQGLVNNAASDEKLKSIVDAYMAANPVGINVDDTLTVSGDAADAKITGDRISELKSELAQYDYGIKFLNGRFVRGTLSGGNVVTSGYDYRIVNEDIMHYSEELTVTLKDGFRYIFARYRSDGEYIDRVTVTSKISTIPADTYFRVSIFRVSGQDQTSEKADISEFKSALMITTNTEKRISKLENVYYVGSTRTGKNTFTTLKSCTEYIRDNNIYDAIVYVDAETFNLVSEYGNSYLDAISSDVNKGFGLMIGNNTHYIFAEGSKVVFEYNGANDACKNYFSPFNAYGGFELENAKIECRNARHCVHEDIPVNATGTKPKNYVVRYTNCNMHHKGTTGSYKAPSCIGAGTYNNSLSIIDGGTYQADEYRCDVLYHNAHVTNPSKIIIRNAKLSNRMVLKNYSDVGNYVDVERINCIIPNGIDVEYSEPMKNFFMVCDDTKVEPNIIDVDGIIEYSNNMCTFDVDRNNITIKTVSGGGSWAGIMLPITDIEEGQAYKFNCRIAKHTGGILRFNFLGNETDPDITYDGLRLVSIENKVYSQFGIAQKGVRGAVIFITTNKQDAELVLTDISITKVEEPYIESKYNRAIPNYVIRKPMVSIIDDDGETEFYDYLLPMIRKYHVPIATAYAGDRGFCDANYMTKEQLDEIVEAGGEVIVHGYTSLADFATVNDAEANVTKSKHMLHLNGFDSEVYVYPTGANNEEIRAMISKHFGCAMRTAYYTEGDEYRINKGCVADYRLNRVHCGGYYDRIVTTGRYANLDTATIAYFAQLVQECIDNNGWLILYTHSFQMPTGRHPSYGYVPSDSFDQFAFMEQIIEYILSRKNEISIVKCSEALDMYANAFVAGDYLGEYNVNGVAINKIGEKDGFN